MTSLAAGCSLALLALPATAASHDSDGMQDLHQAVGVVHEMVGKPEIAQLLRDAKGILIVPHYGSAALVAGVSGGDGVLIAREHGSWSNPMFYNLGKVSVGLQAGGSGGSIAMILLSDRAVNSFHGNNNFSLTADAGLSIINWSADTQADVGKGHDVVVWSDTQGLLGRASVGVADISYDQEENTQFYHRRVSSDEIMNGEVPNRHSQPLKDALGKL
ncbi:MAG TPA: lipid-binding SYLF domain-containing protein [Opitutus sp.]|nr:lipid-binding SYLF domain-containing protein [Opitutus sp.]